jgi:TRAP-type C4-dicarboxylate transport system permease small subunit
MIMNANTLDTQAPGATGTTTKVGLVLAALLGLADIAGGISQLASDALLPVVVAATAIGLGAITVVLVPFAWCGAGWPSWTIIATRALSTLTALPAFFVPGVPAAAVIAATVGIALAVLAIVLILMRGRTPVPAGVR